MTVYLDINEIFHHTRCIYAEACDKFAGYLRVVASDLKLPPPAPETNSLPRDQLAGSTWILAILIVIIVANLLFKTRLIISKSS